MSIEKDKSPTELVKNVEIAERTTSQKAKLYNLLVKKNEEKDQNVLIFNRKGLRSYSKKTGHYFLVPAKSYLKRISNFIQTELDTFEFSDQFIEQSDAFPYWTKFLNWSYQSKSQEPKNLKQSAVGFKNKVVDFSTMEISTHNEEIVVCSGIDVEYTSSLPKKETLFLLDKLFLGGNVNSRDAFLFGEFQMMLKMVLLRKTSHNIAFCIHGGNKLRRTAILELIRHLVNDDMLLLDLNDFFKDLKKEDIYSDSKSVSVLIFPEVELGKITNNMSRNIGRLIDNKYSEKWDDVLLIFSTEEKTELSSPFWQKQVLFIPLINEDNDEGVVDWSNMVQTILKDLSAICNLLGYKILTSQTRENKIVQNIESLNLYNDRKMNETEQTPIELFTSWFYATFRYKAPGSVKIGFGVKAKEGSAYYSYQEYVENHGGDPMLFKTFTKNLDNLVSSHNKSNDKMYSLRIRKADNKVRALMNLTLDKNGSPLLRRGTSTLKDPISNVIDALKVMGFN